MSESIFLKVTSALWVGGVIARPGEIIEVSYAEAKDLLQRGKVVLANAEDAPKVAPKPGPISLGETDESEGEAEAPVETKSRRKK